MYVQKDQIFFVYADDAKLFSHMNGIRDVHILQSDPNSMDRWIKELSLKLNAELFPMVENQELLNMTTLLEMKY